MATTYRNKNGMVVKAHDEERDIDYFYVADDMGDPVIGAWKDEESALFALDCGENASAPRPDFAMNEYGELIDWH